MKKAFILLLLLIPLLVFNSYLLIPMDYEQSDHLRAYGIVYKSLERGNNVHWLLDYRGGSFIIEEYENAYKDACKWGVLSYMLDESGKFSILTEVENNYLKDVLLEKAPKIAVYSPKDKEPWDDAVTLALDYADIKYDVVYDKEILNGMLNKYEWLHLHHEDFTGQFDRFYLNSYNQKWFQELYTDNVILSKEMGYKKYWLMKRDVAIEVSDYIKRGGFLFAMCSATNSIDIALALGKDDNIPIILDGDGFDEITLDYTNTFAFKDFNLNQTRSMNLANINYEPPSKQLWQGLKFELNHFAPRIDVVEAMLTQNHEQFVSEFLGRTTSYNKEKIRNDVIILANSVNDKYAKYIHGNYGDGFFTFLAGHDPEDYVHYVNDPPTDLSFFKHSPGYRLILNNVLFPASKQKKKKT